MESWGMDWTVWANLCQDIVIHRLEFESIFSNMQKFGVARTALTYCTKYSYQNLLQS